MLRRFHLFVRYGEMTDMCIVKCVIGSAVVYENKERRDSLRKCSGHETLEHDYLRSIKKLKNFFDYCRLTIHV